MLVAIGKLGKLPRGMCALARNGLEMLGRALTSFETRRHVELAGDVNNLNTGRDRARVTVTRRHYLRILSATPIFRRIVAATFSSGWRGTQWSE